MLQIDNNLVSNRQTLFFVRLYICHEIKPYILFTPKT